METMKKNYQKPTMTVATFQQTHIICQSPTGLPATHNEVSSGDVYSRESGDWDDE